MFSTDLSVNREHLDKTKFLIFGAWEMMPSMASSVTRAQAVKSSMRRCSKERVRTSGGNSSDLCICGNGLFAS
jgi:hypothetical protein